LHSREGRKNSSWYEKKGVWSRSMEWFSFDLIPFSQMWSDDEYWYPLFLGDKLFRGAFLFDKPSDVEYSARIITKELHVVKNL